MRGVQNVTVTFGELYEALSLSRMRQVGERKKNFTHSSQNMLVIDNSFLYTNYTSLLPLYMFIQPI